jgi:site-specific recombinase XerD
MFAGGLADELAALGYSTTSATNKLQLAAHLSRWLDADGTALGELTPVVISRFLDDRRRDHRGLYSWRSLAPIVDYLRRAGAVPPASSLSPTSCGVEGLLERFGNYLCRRRALTAPVVRAYTHWVRPFVEEVLWDGGIDRVGDLDAAAVTGFLAVRLPGMSRKSAQMTACAVRSLLRFLHVEAMVEVSLVGAVPPVASWKLSGLPQALTADQVQALLDACDPGSAVGRRDRAVITMLRRLGLRCAEVAGLCLDDIDWLAGTVTVRGKASRVDRLPLPADVGEVLVDYLRHGRPKATTRALFLRAVAPFTPLHATSVSCVVARAAQRAGLGTVHAHRLRHTAATETLNAGASLEEVAQLLRHEGIATTVVYAKTDWTRLARLARPWPATAGAR